MENKYLHKATVIWVNFCRFLLAFVLMFSGFVKGNDPMGTVYKIQEYLDAWALADWSTGFTPYLIAWIIAIIEFTIGSYFLFGIRRMVATVVNLMFMIFMTPLTLWLALTNPISDCGCFGDVVLLSNWETFWKNVFLLIASVTVLLKRKYIVKFVTPNVDWLIALYSTVFIFVFSQFTLRNLPVFDFRPYYVGADIKKGMEVPEGEKLPVYETIFTYQKNGEKKDFTIDNFPNDTTWKFVESRTILKEKGYEPPIKDFIIVSNEDGLDITQDILDADYAFLLVAPWLEKADDGSMDLINELYDYAVDHGYMFYCLTASSDDGIALWQDYTGAEYPFATLDEITLKTMVRSNPGVLLLKKGVVIRKWSNNSLPDEYQLTDALENLPLGQLSGETVAHKAGRMLLWYFGPLVLLTAIDVLWVTFRKRRKSKPAEGSN